MLVATAWHRAARYLDELSEHWLGWSLPPAERAIEQAAWSPDPTSAYCPHCGDSVGTGEVTGSGCGTCRVENVLPRFDRIVRLGPYVDPLRPWIVQVKYHQRWAEMAVALGRLLGKSVCDAKCIDGDRTVVTPMPMPMLRQWYRGIDHARLIARGVADAMGVPMIRLMKRANGSPQVELRASERGRRSSRDLRLCRRMGGWRLADVHLVIVDDVRTTGASLRAAERIIRPLKPAKLVAAVAGVSDAAARRDRSKQQDSHEMADD